MYVLTAGGYFNRGMASVLWQDYECNSCYYLLLLILFVIWSWDSLFFIPIAFILRITKIFCRTVKMTTHDRQGRVEIFLRK